MKTRAHPMPFGAQVREDGSVRFRLWAPAVSRVDLCLEVGGQVQRQLRMAALPGGWFECVTEDAAPGALYRYRIGRGYEVPDPASRFQPRDVHGPSEVIDPAAFAWRDQSWRGRPWEDAVFYELHVGTFSPQGTFRGVAERLDYLVDLGVTAIELMPVADFPGGRNWGYDGALPFAPDGSYGRPEDLKALVQAAHERGLMVFLDVVYNHFGPEGNYLHLYAPQFFNDRHRTPWGAGINFDGDGSRPVRDFFIHNALYWLTEYRFDGLRLDAVQAIVDDSVPHVLTELAEAVEAGPGRERRIHLVLENDANTARYLQRRDDGSPRWYVAQWSDDFHHALHLLATGEEDGYYVDYAQAPMRCLGRCLVEGFAYQGEPSAFRHGAPRGEPSAHLPSTAFLNLIQNHDQVGNRALGERIGELVPPRSLRVMLALLLLAPSPPLLFMGQEFMATSPFLFFCDFEGGLARAVREGRQREFARFERFADPRARLHIPDPNDPETFNRSRLDWEPLDREPHRAWHQFHRDLLALRKQEISPRLEGLSRGAGSFRILGERGLQADWRLGDGSRLRLRANLGHEVLADPSLIPRPGERLLHSEPGAIAADLAGGRLAPWSVAWHLDSRGSGQ